MQRVKHFSHNDTDGLGCIVLSLLAYGDHNVDYTICTNTNRNELVKQYLDRKEYENYKKCFITDLSICEELAQRIEALNLQDHFLIFDHHKTALWLNKYTWCEVVECFEDGFKPCGTSLYYTHLLNDYCIPFTQHIHTRSVASFVEYVRSYDVWDWVQIDNVLPSQFALLIEAYGMPNYIEKMVLRLKEHILLNKPSFTFNDIDNLLIDSKTREKHTYIEGKLKSVQKYHYKKYLVGFVFADRYKSELGNTVCKQNPQLDFCIIIDMDGTLSYRTSRNDIDISSIAQQFQGGGHAKAAGSPFNRCHKDTFLQSLFGTIQKY